MLFSDRGECLDWCMVHSWNMTHQTPKAGTPHLIVTHRSGNHKVYSKRPLLTTHTPNAISVSINQLFEMSVCVLSPWGMNMKTSIPVWSTFECTLREALTHTHTQTRSGSLSRTANLNQASHTVQFIQVFFVLQVFQTTFIHSSSLTLQHTHTCFKMCLKSSGRNTGLGAQLFIQLVSGS